MVTFSGYTTPPAVLGLRAPGAAGESAIGQTLHSIAQVQTDVALADVVVRTEHVTSSDGTRVPIQLIHRRGIERDGQNPVLLYGYGGFNVSLLPGFQRNILYWLEQGGVYAVANLRGGGEFGEAWHQAGNRENKGARV